MEKLVCLKKKDRLRSVPSQNENDDHSTKDISTYSTNYSLCLDTFCTLTKF